jgi:hypothetical protein
MASSLPLLILLWFIVLFPESGSAQSLTPPPSRFGFRATDDPVGFIPDVVSQVPNPPVHTYNPDGTLIGCPVEFSKTRTYTYPALIGPEASVAFIQKKLKGGTSGCADSIQFNGTAYPVYSTVPQMMTIQYGYQNPFGYFDQTQLPQWSNGTIVPPSAAAQLNCGRRTGTTPGFSQTGDNSALLVAKNSEAACLSYSQYYIPNLPNTKGPDGLTDLDHSGLTENIVWSTDEYKQVDNDPNYLGATDHLFQYGWAFDPRNVGQDVYWTNLNNIASGGPRLCRTRSPADAPPALRRPRRQKLSRAGQRDEAAVRPTGGRRQAGSARRSSLIANAVS